MTVNGHTSPVAITRAPTPTSYSLAIADLPTDQIVAERRRLDASQVKLQETIDQLDCDEYRGQMFAIDAIDENRSVIESYSWRRGIIATELERRGASTQTQPNQTQSEGIDL